MSLDVLLTTPREIPPFEGTGVYLKAGEGFREVSLAEWEDKMGTIPVDHLLGDWTPFDIVFDWNITHNLGKMASQAGVYEALWRPDEHGITHAKQLIDPLREGLARLEADPMHFKTFNPSNGWSDYEGLVRFVREYLRACEQHPEARVEISR